MSKLIKPIFVALLLIGQAKAESLTIRIGTPGHRFESVASGGIAITTFLDAKKLIQDEFAKDGIVVDWNFFMGAGPAVNEAIANKQIDFAYLGDLPAIIGRSSGLSTRFLLPARGNRSFLAVTPGSKIENLADLKGKRLAVFMGTAFHLSLDRALAHAGLTERDLHVVNLDWNSTLAALANNQIDAGWAGASMVALSEKGLAKIALSTKELGRDNTFTSGFVGTEEFISAHPDLTQRLVNVLVRVQFWLSQPVNHAEFLAVTSERSGVPLSLGHAEYDGDDMAFRFSPCIDDFILASLQTSVNQAKDLGLIRKTFDVRTWVEPRFVDKALTDLNLNGFWRQYDEQGQPKPK